MESNRYKEAIERLKADPAIIAMADELMESANFSLDPLHGDQYEHTDGTPRFEFMKSALAEYHDRGGKVPTHIGGPARAVLAIIKEKVGAQTEA